MAQYAYDYLYDFESFAPKKNPSLQPDYPVVEPKIVRPAKKTKSQLRIETNNVRKRMLLIVGVSVLLFALFGFRISLGATLNEKTKQLSDIQNEISVQKSESVYLNNQLNEIVNLQTVEDVAVHKLHMVKKESSQIQYIVVGDTSNITDGSVVTE